MLVRPVNLLAGSVATTRTGDAEADVTVNIQQTATPEKQVVAFDTVIRAGTSDENSLVRFTGCGLVQPIRCVVTAAHGTL